MRGYRLILILILVIHGACYGQEITTTNYYNGDTYTGTRDGEGRRSGWGTLIWANGDRYDGEWSKDMPHGHGTLVWADGSRYEGNWVRGQRQGNGTYFSAKGYSITGKWKKGSCTGTGYLSFGTNDTYEGEFVNAFSTAKAYATSQTGVSITVTSATDT